VGVFLSGCVSFWRRDRKALWVLGLPAAFALLAACLRQYPFHGRLVLFLVPALLLVIAEGAGRLRARLGRGVPWAVVLGALLCFPSLGVLYHLVQPRGRDGLNPYGDRPPSRLDPDWFPFREWIRPAAQGPDRHPGRSDR
jgi:hypothetical protein